MSGRALLRPWTLDRLLGIIQHLEMQRESEAAASASESTLAQVSALVSSQGDSSDLKLSIKSSKPDVVLGYYSLLTRMKTWDPLQQTSSGLKTTDE